MAEQLFQIGIKGLIRNHQGEILLLAIRKWKDTNGYWDLPGGRMEPDEQFVDTLQRELQEEIGVTYDGEPKFLSVVLSNLKIPVGDTQIPLVLMAYEVSLPNGAKIVLGEDEAEQAFDWFPPAEAAKLLARKYPADFCDAIAKL